MAKREPKLLDCIVINEIDEGFNRNVCKALAEALHRQLESEEFKDLIRELEEVK